MESRSFNIIDQQKLLSDILSDDEDKSLFVLNNTDRPDRNGKPTRSAGVLLMSALVNGESRAIRIPVSWVPVDLSVQAPRKAITESAEFNRALASQAIMIMTREQALKLIRGDQASMDEYDRAMAISQGINGAADVAYHGVNGTDVNEEEDPWENVDVGLRALVEDLTAGGNTTKVDIMSYMRRNERSMSPLDRKYMEEKMPG